SPVSLRFALASRKAVASSVKASSETVLSAICNPPGKLDWPVKLAVRVRSVHVPALARASVRGVDRGRVGGPPPQRWFGGARRVVPGARGAGGLAPAVVADRPRRLDGWRVGPSHADDPRARASRGVQGGARRAGGDVDRARAGRPTRRA